MIQEPHMVYRIEFEFKGKDYTVTTISRAASHNRLEQKYPGALVYWEGWVLK